MATELTAVNQSFVDRKGSLANPVPRFRASNADRSSPEELSRLSRSRLAAHETIDVDCLLVFPLHVRVDLVHGAS